MNIPSHGSLRLLLAAASCAVGFAVPAAAQAEEPETTATQNLIEVADEVAKEVEELRGWSFKEPVKKAVYSEDELRAFLNKKLWEEEYPEEKLEHLQAFLHMTGLVPPDTDLRSTIVDVLMNQIGGFYDPPTKSFYMIQREGVEWGPLIDRILIAHELTHALDDQHVDLEGTMAAAERTEDVEFALGSVVEGSATALMSRYVANMQLSGELTMEDLNELVKSEEERGDVFFEAPPYFRTLLARYNLGMLFIVRGNMMTLMSPTGGETVGKNLKKAMANPPRSSEQILHPERYWDPAQRDEPVVADDDFSRSLFADAGFQVAAVNTAGEIGMGVLTTPADKAFNMMDAVSADGWTNSASTGWGGDRFYLLEPIVLERGSESGTYRGAWITAWDTPEDREEFVKAYEATVASEDRHRVDLSDRVSVFLYGMTPTEKDKVARTLELKPPHLTKKERPFK